MMPESWGVLRMPDECIVNVSMIQKIKNNVNGTHKLNNVKKMKVKYFVFREIVLHSKK